MFCIFEGMSVRGFIKLLVAAAAIVAVPFDVNAGSSYKFTHLTTENSGLSYDGVSRIMQDSRGFIWIGTYHGLNRYDGRRFDVFTASDIGLSTDFIHCFAEDRDGNVWVGTDCGVTRYNYVLDRFEPLDIKSDSGETIRNKVTFITQDEYGRIWMLVNGQGIFSYDTKYSHLHHISYSKLGVSGCRRLLCSAKSGAWISVYHSSLYHAPSGLRDISSIEKFRDGGYFDGDEIEGIYEGADGQVYVVSGIRGVSEIDPESGAIRQLFALPEGTVLIDSFFECERWIWLTTTEGVWRYDLRGTATRRIECDMHDRFSLSGNYVTCAFVDDGGGVWIGTKDGGVNWCGPAQNNFKKHYSASGSSLDGCIVSGFAEQSPQKVWITTEQEGLLLWNPVTGSVDRMSAVRNGSMDCGLNLHASVSHIVLRGLPQTLCSPCIDGKYLWLGSLKGVWRLDTETFAVKSYGALRHRGESYSAGENHVAGGNHLTEGNNRSDSKVYVVYKSAKGDIYAASTLGLSKYDSESDCFVDTCLFDGVFITSMDEDAEGNLWLSTFASGIYRWNPETGDIENFCAAEDCGMPSDKVSSVHVDASGRVWAIGFGHGFSVYVPENRRFTVYEKSAYPSLSSDVFFCCAEDGNGNLWLTSDAGLLQYNPETSGMRLYTEIEGLLDTKLTNSALRLSNGDLCFGSDNGFISFSPNRLRTGGNPDIVISGMHIGDRTVTMSENLDLMDEIRLKSDEKSFGFDFSVLDMSSASSSWIQCRLKGYDTEWKDISTSRKAFWYNVPSGKYVLQIRSSASSTEWHDAHFPLQITVLPTFWASPWGIVLIITMVLTIVAVVAGFVVRSFERKRRQMEIDYKKAREEDVFRERMNTVSQIVGLPKKDQDFLSEFDRTVRDNLSNPMLSNEIIAYKMAVSPSTLVRRIRRLLDTSPNNYVRNLRLGVAAEMLRDPHGNNISEICYAVGFSNVSYFAKCFREIYGKTPTAFMEEARLNGGRDDKQKVDAREKS